MRFGIELEAIGLTREEVVSLLATAGIQCVDADYTHRVMNTWKVVRDGSLQSPLGFELVSPPLEYNEENLEQVRRVIEVINEAGAYVNARCGMHVHFEVSHLTPEHVANIFNRYRKFEESFDAIVPPSRRRSNNSYCRSLRDERECFPLSTVAETCRPYTERFRKINMTSFVKYGTLEFRQHAGSLNRVKATNWLRLIAQFIEASKPVAVPVAAIDPAIKGKSRRIVDLLQDAGSAGLMPETLAEILGMTKPSVQSAVCRLRRNHGYHISNGKRYVLLTATPVVENATDTFWKGISSNLKTYYERRAQALAS